MIDRKMLGRLGENAAASYLERHGYRILARNYRYHRYEFDIIASLADEIIIFEVKTRNMAAGDPAVEALSRRQIRVLKWAMAGYAISRRQSLEKMRLDFIALDWQPERQSFRLHHYVQIY